MAHKAKTFCRNCSAVCSMELTVEGNKILSAAGDGTASPYGAYMCPKGLAAVDFHNGAEGRLFSSLKRQPDGSFVEIDASQALDEIGAKLAALLKEYGPRSIALYHGTGAYRDSLGNLFERAFQSAIGTPNFFSSMTVDQSAKWITWGRMGLMASGKPSLRDIDLGVIVGNNPLVSHLTAPFTPGENGAPGRAYEEAKKRGTRFIVIDPRRTETARYADLLIQPLPGHDAALFASIAHILLRDGTYNKDFCDRFVSQIDALRAAVAPFTPEVAAARAGVPVEQIERAAQWIGEAKRAFVGSGTGPSMSDHSNLNDHMIETVNALVGGYGRAGDLVRNPGTIKPRTVTEMVIPPDRSWEKGIKCRSADVGAMYGELPTALLHKEILIPGPDKIRALIVFGGNPLMAMGDTREAIPGFEDLDLLVVLDSRLNQTGRLAHYVIATSQPFERHDISIPGDSAYPTAFAQYTPPVVPRPAGVIDDWEFFWAAAARMGIQLTLKYWNYGLQYDAIPEGLPLDTGVRPEPEEMIRYLCKDSRVSFDELKANPSGVRPDIAPEYIQASEDNGARLELCPPDVQAELAALAAERPDTRFKYRLTCRRLLETMNSAYLGSRRAKRRYPVNWAYMNPDDLAEEGIEDGTEIEIASENGCIVGVVKAEDRVRRGVISMTHLFGTFEASSNPWRQGGSSTGQLSSLERNVEPINFMPRFSGIPVNIEASASPSVRTEERLATAG